MFCLILGKGEIGKVVNVKFERGSFKLRVNAWVGAGGAERETMQCKGA